MEEINDSQTIKQFQQKLKSQGKDVESDGMVGPKTQKARRTYQWQQGLETSGKVDQKTASKLEVQPRAE